MKNILLLLILFPSIVYSQSKYLIYFKDKTISKINSLNKSSAIYQEALSQLSERAIERREKVMPADKIITYEDLPIRKDYIAQLENLGIKIENKLNWFNAVSAYLTEDQKNKIEEFSFVKEIDLVRILKFNPEKMEVMHQLKKIGNNFSQIDYGPAYGQLKLSDIPIVHSKGINGKGVIIGILDNGFHWRDHESLVNKKIIGEYNFVFHDSSTAPQPGDSPESGLHGTYVFSILGGYKDSSLIGAAYNASFILAKTEDDRSESHIEEDNYAAALEWMEGLGVDITTSSLGYNIFDDTTYSYTYKDMDGKTTICAKAVELAFQRGVLTFTAAGNEGNQAWYYIDTPADGLHIIAVGAVDANNKVAYFSSHGPTYDGRIKPDVVAQGVNVYGAAVAIGYNAYDYNDGTSAATPIASGCGALLLSAFPYLTNVQARNILLETADNYATPNNDRGYGLISAEKAIEFPNISDSSNNFNINKIFFSQNGIQSNSAEIHYSTNDTNFVTSNLSYDGSLKYYYTMPQLINGQIINFYFTYSDTIGNNLREPSSGYYNFKYGQLNIASGTLKNSIEFNNVLSNNYPNPFSSTTNISFISKGNEIAKLVILNAIGQTVKILFNGVSEAGINTLTWDGKSDRGIKCASGVYYYILTLGGKNYGNKMVLVK